MVHIDPSCLLPSALPRLFRHAYVEGIRWRGPRGTNSSGHSSLVLRMIYVCRLRLWLCCQVGHERVCPVNFGTPAECREGLNWSGSRSVHVATLAFAGLQPPQCPTERFSENNWDNKWRIRGVYSSLTTLDTWHSIFLGLHRGLRSAYGCQCQR